LALPNLPEPNAFTLPEIAERWECTEEMLISYCESDMLNIQVGFNEAVAIRESKDPFTDELYPGEFEEFLLSGFYTVPKDVAIGSWRLGEGGWSEEYSPSFKLVFDDEGETQKLKQRHTIDSSNLRITKFERNRFEVEHDVVIDVQYPHPVLHPEVIESEYWKNLERMTMDAIKEYPDWAEKVGQRKIQKTGNLLDWVKRSQATNEREAHVIVRVLSETFKIT